MERLELSGSLFMRKLGVLCLYSLIKSGAWTELAGSQVLSLSGYPFHRIKNWSLLFRPK